MILFTSRPMSGEHAGRETQNLEFYFTDHSLTGQSTSLSTAGLPHKTHAGFFSTDRTLTDALRLRESDADRQPARRRSDCRGRAFARCSPSLFH